MVLLGVTCPFPTRQAVFGIAFLAKCLPSIMTQLSLGICLKFDLLPVDYRPDASNIS